MSQARLPANPASAPRKPRRVKATFTVPQAAVLEEARQAGLTTGEKTVHFSFRVPPALLEAAKAQTGIASTTELGLMAPALLAQPDPVAAFFKRTRGALGPDHTVDYRPRCDRSAPPAGTPPHATPAPAYRCGRVLVQPAR